MTINIFSYSVALSITIIFIKNGLIRERWRINKTFSQSYVRFFVQSEKEKLYENLVPLEKKP